MWTCSVIQIIKVYFQKNILAYGNKIQREYTVLTHLSTFKFDFKIWL